MHTMFTTFVCFMYTLVHLNMNTHYFETEKQLKAAFCKNELEFWLVEHIRNRIWQDPADPAIFNSGYVQLARIQTHFYETQPLEMVFYNNACKSSHVINCDLECNPNIQVFIVRLLGDIIWKCYQT